MNDSYISIYPLLNFFISLQEKGFLLGINDYMAFIEAIGKGYSVESIDDVHKLCEMLWLKNTKDKPLFKKLFDNKIEEELDKLERLFNTDKPITKKENVEFADKNKNKIDKDFHTPKSKEEKPDLQPGTSHDLKKKSGSDYKTVYLSLDGKVDGTKVKIKGKKLKDGYKFSFSQRNFLPLTERPLQIHLRNLKNVVSEPDFENLDIDACIESITEKGFLSELFYKKKYVNTTSVVTIVDIEGSMKLFKWLCKQLIEIISTDLINEVFYCDNLPIPYLYSDLQLKNEIEWESFCKLKLKDKYVVIISDAGAIKGKHNTNRIKTTIGILNQIDQFAKNTVWMNPMPYYRWHGSSAKVISKHVAMFETSYSGILEAVNHLKYNIRRTYSNTNV